MKKLPNFGPGGIYHVFNHANGRENVFEKPENYEYFMRKYVEKVAPVVKTVARCLMPNHFHLLIRVREEAALLDFLKQKREKEPVPVPKELTKEDLCHFIVHRQFHNFFGGYSKAFNKYHGRSGSLLRQNTHRKLVAEKDYLKNAIRYLHLNPVFHGFTTSPLEWQFSSYHDYLGDAPTIVPRAGVLEWFGGRDAFIQFHEEKMTGGLDTLFEG